MNNQIPIFQNNTIPTFQNELGNEDEQFCNTSDILNFCSYTLADKALNDYLSNKDNKINNDNIINSVNKERNKVIERIYYIKKIKNKINKADPFERSLYAMIQYILRFQNTDTVKNININKLRFQNTDKNKDRVKIKQQLIDQLIHYNCNNNTDSTSIIGHARFETKKVDDEIAAKTLRDLHPVDEPHTLIDIPHSNTNDVNMIMCSVCGDNIYDIYKDYYIAPEPHDPTSIRKNNMYIRKNNMKNYINEDFKKWKYCAVCNYFECSRCNFISNNCIKKLNENIANKRDQNVLVDKYNKTHSITLKNTKIRQNQTKAIQVLGNSPPPPPKIGFFSRFGFGGGNNTHKRKQKRKRTKRTKRNKSRV